MDILDNLETLVPKNLKAKAQTLVPAIISSAKKFNPEKIIGNFFQKEIPESLTALKKVVIATEPTYTAKQVSAIGVLVSSIILVWVISSLVFTWKRGADDPETKKITNTGYISLTGLLCIGLILGVVFYNIKVLHFYKFLKNTL